MRLLIIRHAIAVERGTKGIADDERPLTPEGEKRFRRAARGLARIVTRPDTILSSPLPRALQTARIAAEAWGKGNVRQVDAIAHGSPDDWVALLDQSRKDATVALVGHEPDVSTFLATLLGSKASDRFTFKKGGAALVDIPGRVAEGGTLVWVLPPRVLRAIR